MTPPTPRSDDTQPTLAGTTLLLVAVTLLALPTQAAVYRCVDGQGHITFTDVACPNPGERSSVKIDPDPAPPAGATDGDVGEGAVAAEREAAEEARARCREGIIPFLGERRAPPEAASATQLQRLRMRIRPQTSEVVFKGGVEYPDGNATLRTEVECRARREGNGPWQVEYQEGVTHSFIQFN